MMITRLGIFIITIIFWEGCDLVKPRAQGADNELVVVASFENRNAIQRNALSLRYVRGMGES